MVRHGILVEPDQPEALADAIRHLYLNPEPRQAIATAGVREVAKFDVNHIAARFVSEMAKVVPALRAGERNEDEYVIGAAKT